MLSIPLVLSHGICRFLRRSPPRTNQQAAVAHSGVVLLAAKGARGCAAKVVEGIIAGWRGKIAENARVLDIYQCRSRVECQSFSPDQRSPRLYGTVGKELLSVGKHLSTYNSRALSVPSQCSLLTLARVSLEALNMVLVVCELNLLICIFNP